MYVFTNLIGKKLHNNHQFTEILTTNSKVYVVFIPRPQFLQYAHKIKTATFTDTRSYFHFKTAVTSAFKF